MDLRLATTVSLGISITDGGLLFCHGISEGSLEKKVSMREYNNRTVYDCFNKTFPDDFDSLALNTPPITTGGIPCPA